MVLSKTDKALLSSSVGKIQAQATGSDVLARMFASFPQTKVYFVGFSDYTAKGPRVQKHGLTVMTKIIEGIQYLGSLRSFLDALSAKHAHELMVDPVNFGFLGECVLSSLAYQLPDFSPEMHCAWDKYLCEFAYLLAEKYR
uniref:Hemoglobin subunit alpha n=1 Tax=Callorhinchus milii TaxID=7868 RepID=K4G5Z9_CALMI|nr:Hemoglobin subunit alpha [Callorhinchus milii]